MNGLEVNVTAKRPNSGAIPPSFDSIPTMVHPILTRSATLISTLVWRVLGRGTGTCVCGTTRTQNVFRLSGL